MGFLIVVFHSNQISKTYRFWRQKQETDIYVIQTVYSKDDVGLNYSG